MFILKPQTKDLRFQIDPNPTIKSLEIWKNINFSQTLKSKSKFHSDTFQAL